MASFDWDLFLSLADELARPPAPEEKLRSAISRAYYACFHAARSYVSTRYPHVRLCWDGTDHQTVWTSLKQPERKREERAAGENGSRLLRSRCKADYDSQLPNAVWQASDDLQRARRTIVLLKDRTSG